MSIICYTGLPGHGKSYSAVENVVLAALRDGRTVAHNLTLNHAAIEAVIDKRPLKLVEFSREATPADLIAACPPGAVILIDEVWRYWPAGIKANEVPKEELKFFKEHRHRVGEDGLATEIVIIDQDPKTGVPAFLRSLIELTYVHKKHSDLGSSGSFRVDVYTRCQSAEKPAKSCLVRKMQGRYRPEVWNCYVSHTQSTKVGEAGLERIADSRGSLLKGWTFRSAVAAALLLPFILWWAGSSFFNIGKAKAKPSKPPVVQVQRGPAPGEVIAAKPRQIAPAASQVAVPVEPPKPAGPVFSRIWRIVGVVWKDDGAGVVLLTSATGRRQLPAKTCAQDAGLNWRCTVEDGIAAPWTGGGGGLSAAVAPGVARDHEAGNL